MQPVPKELRGEERLFSIKSLGIHFYKKSLYYNGPAMLVTAFVWSVTNNPILLVTTFITLNLIAFPLGHVKVAKSKIDGGNVPLDVYLFRKYRYKYKGKNVYLRKLPSKKADGGKK